MANSSFYNSNAAGYSQPTTGASSSWDDFYRGITPSRAAPGTTNGGLIERSPSPGPASPYMTAAERAQWEKLYGPGRAPVPTGAPPTQLASIPMPRPRPGYAPTSLDIAAMNAPMPPAAMPTAVAAEMSTVPPVPAAAPPSGGQLAALLEAAQGLGGLLSGVLPGGSGMPVAPPRPRIAANALIDGQRGRDNEPGANYMGRSVGSDGIVRGYNQDTKRFENLSQNSKKSPSQSYKKDRLGDRDMRRTSKQKYDY